MRVFSRYFSIDLRLLLKVWGFSSHSYTVGDLKPGDLKLLSWGRVSFKMHLFVEIWIVVLMTARTKPPRYYLMTPQAHVIDGMVFPTPPKKPEQKPRLRSQRFTRAPVAPVAMIGVEPEIGFGVILLKSSAQGKAVRVLAAHVDDWFGERSVGAAIFQLTGFLGSDKSGFAAYFVAPPIYLPQVDAGVRHFAENGVVFDDLVINTKVPRLDVSLHTGQILTDPIPPRFREAGFSLGERAEIDAHIRAAEGRRVLSEGYYQDCSFLVDIGGSVAHQVPSSRLESAPLRRLRFSDIDVCAQG